MMKHAMIVLGLLWLIAVGWIGLKFMQPAPGAGQVFKNFPNVAPGEIPADLSNWTFTEIK